MLEKAVLDPPENVVPAEGDSLGFELPPLSR